MNKNFLLVLISVFVLALTACNPVEDQLRQVNDHWAAAVELENAVDAQFRRIMTATNEGYMQIRNTYPLIDQCFENSGEVITNAVQGRYVAAGNENAAVEEVNGFAIGQALVVNENYPGDITVCQELIQNISDDIEIWRQGRSEEFARLWDMKANLDTHYNEDLVTTYRNELINIAREEATRLGITDFSGTQIYPTFHLEAETRDRNICDWYQASWNPALNNCNLSGQGAYDYIFRTFVSVEVQSDFDAGIDTLDPLATQAPE